MLDIQTATLDTDGSCVKVAKLADKQQELVSECWRTEMLSSANQNLVLPPIALSPSFTYLVSYTRGKSSTTNIPVLMSASFSYSSVNGCAFDRNLTSSKLIITPLNYPNDVPVVDPVLYEKQDPKDDCGWRVNTSTATGFVHAVFHEIDLSGSQQIVLSYDKNSKMLDKTTTSPSDDILANQTMMIKLKTPLSSSGNISSQTGRGFKVAVEEVPCGGVVNITAIKQLSTPGYPKDAFTQSRCLWIVTGGKDDSVLNISKVFGTGDQKDGILTIIDSGSTRDLTPRLVNQANATATYSSVNTIVVEYSLKSGAKTAPALQITFDSLGMSASS